MLGRQLQLEGPKKHLRVQDATPLLNFPSFSSARTSGDDEPTSRFPITKKPLTGFSLITMAGSIIRSLFPSIRSFLSPSCSWLMSPPATVPTTTRPRRKKVTGTFFGSKRGRVCFAVQDDTRSDPLLLLELAISTAHLVKEMSSGMVRILLECDRDDGAVKGARKQGSLWDEPLWSMNCNGQKRGYAVSRACSESDFHVLSAVQTISVGAGVVSVPYMAPALPPPHQPLERKGSYKSDGWISYDSTGGSGSGTGGGGSEVMYMRAKFERVIGGRDSEAFYMISPECSSSNRNKGGPELSIFLLRM